MKFTILDLNFDLLEWVGKRFTTVVENVQNIA